MSPSATLEQSGTTLEPGGAASVPLVVGNDGDLVDEYRFRVVGPLAPWSTVEPAIVSVYPGDSATVTLLFRPPRSWEVPAGRAPYGVQVLPAQRPEDTVVVEGTVDVLPFWDLRAELVPRTSEGRAGGRHRVAVDNRSNATIVVELEAKDPEEKLEAAIVPSTLRIAPGTMQSADLRVRPVRRIWRGGQQAHPFTVEVRPDGGLGTVLAGTHRQDPLLPGWSPRLLKYLVVLGVITALVLAAVLFFTRVVVPGVGGIVSRVRPCVQGAVVGDFTACQELLGAEPRQDPGGEDGTGGEQGGGGEPEQTAVELTAEAEAGQFGQDVREVEDEGTVFTSVVVRTSAGDDGVFLLSIDGTPITQQLSMSGIQDGEQEFSLGEQGLAVNAGRQLQLDLRCDSADDELLEPDVCEVTTELRGVVVPPGG